MKRKALGKGLRSLIRETPPPRTVPPKTTEPLEAPEAPQTSPAGERLLEIDLDRISPNPDQPRADFAEDELDELAISMKTAGVLQPVVVRPRADGRFELIAGERRWRAAQRAGLMKIPAVLRDVEDSQLREFALIENLQRANLNAIETAEAYQALMLEHDLDQQELSDRLGKPRTTIANALRLLNLPPEVQRQIRSGALSAGHAKALASLANTQAQIELASRIVDEGLSVRNVESIAARIVKARTATPSVRRTPERDPNVEAAETELQRTLGTKVRIVSKRKGGHLEIHYYSDEELERLYQIISDSARR